MISSSPWRSMRQRMRFCANPRRVHSVPCRLHLVKHLHRRPCSNSHWSSSCSGCCGVGVDRSIRRSGRRCWAGLPFPPQVPSAFRSSTFFSCLRSSLASAPLFSIQSAALLLASYSTNLFSRWTLHRTPLWFGSLRWGLSASGRSNCMNFLYWLYLFRCMSAAHNKLNK